MDDDKIKLSRKAQKKLGGLIELKDDLISNAIKDRGGGQSQINQLRSDYKNLKVGELANLATQGDQDAETAIKILKQAKKKHDKYGSL